MTKAAKPRAALALLPTFGTVEPGRDAYLTRPQIARRIHTARRWWTFRGAPSTLELPEGKVYAKCSTPFADHTEEAPFLELIRECSELGVPRPTGYADVFHEHFKLPRIKWSHNACLASRFVGGWQQALVPGVHRGPHFKYDLRSAYLWAGMLGLPDPRSYRLVHERQRLPAVYRVELERPVPDAPYPFNRATDVLASSEELDVYSLPVRRVLTGVAWTRELDPEPMVRAIRSLGHWKPTARMYWGRWAQSEGVDCHVASGKSWPLPSMSTNIVAAHLIVSRVKLKLWPAAAGAVHVFVDSVITPRQIPMGPLVGDFQLEGYYSQGVTVRRAGWYGPIGGPLEKATGVPHASPRRALALAG